MGKLAVYRYVAMMFLVIQVVVSVFTFVALNGGDVTTGWYVADGFMLSFL